MAVLEPSGSASPEARFFAAKLLVPWTRSGCGPGEAAAVRTSLLAAVMHYCGVGEPERSRHRPCVRQLAAAVAALAVSLGPAQWPHQVASLGKHFGAAQDALLEVLAALATEVLEHGDGSGASEVELVMGAAATLGLLQRRLGEGGGATAARCNAACWRGCGWVPHRWPSCSRSWGCCCAGS